METVNSKEKLSTPSTSPKGEVPKIETSLSSGPDKRNNDKKDKSKDKDDKDKSKDVSKDVKDVKDVSKDVKEGVAHKPVHKRPGHRRVASEAISAKDLVKKTMPTLPAITMDTSHVHKSDKEGKRDKDKKPKDKEGKDKKHKGKSSTLKRKSPSADSGELSARSESSEHSETPVLEGASSVKALQSEPALPSLATDALNSVPSRTSAPELKTSDDGAGNHMAVQLVKRIGKGATATVWEGLLNGQPVALKQVHLGVRVAWGSGVGELTRSIFRA